MHLHNGTPFSRLQLLIRRQVQNQFSSSNFSNEVNTTKPVLCAGDAKAAENCMEDCVCLFLHLKLSSAQSYGGEIVGGAGFVALGATNFPAQQVWNSAPPCSHCQRGLKKRGRLVRVLLKAVLCFRIRRRFFRRGGDRWAHLFRHVRRMPNAILNFNVVLHCPPASFAGNK